MKFIPSTSFPVHLNHLSLICIQGVDAGKFLQGQLTGDVLQLPESKGLFTACCDPKGRMLASFLLWRAGEDFYVLLPKTLAEMTLAHLKKYVLFSKVTLQIEANPEQFVQSNPAYSNENAWRAANIESGLVWIYPQTRELLIPQMVNLEQWDGVSFKKGCYVGQEIIARTENLGKLKRHLYRAEIDNSPLQIGDPILNSEKTPIGLVVEKSSEKILAVLQDQLLSNTQNNPLKNIQKI